MGILSTLLRTGRTPVHAAELEISSIHIQKACTRGERHETSVRRAGTAFSYQSDPAGCEASSTQK